MGNAIRNTILIMVYCLVLLPFAYSQDIKDFKETDSLTYRLYEEGRWKELVKESKVAFQLGYDYFYLRMRAGIAYYELGNYMQAAIHLEKALEFNSGDRYARELLYYAYLMQNKGHDALALLKASPESLRLELKNETPPGLHFAHAEAGWFFSNQDKMTRQEDIDGRDDLYGEASIMNYAYYLSAGGKWFATPWYSGYLNYRYLSLDRNKLVMSGDTLLADDNYLTTQHQIYHSSSFFPGNGLTITPSFHFIHYSLQTIFPQFDDQTGQYHFPDSSISDDNFIGYLGLKKDFRIIHSGVFGAAANLNNAAQYQAGFELWAYPAGNLNLYLNARYVAHFNDGDFQPVVQAMVGGRLFEPVWLEVSGSYGQVKNYFENGASSVYNFQDEIRFKYGAKLIATLTSRWMLSLGYEYLGKQAEILFYRETGGNNSPDILPDHRTVNYIDQYLTASILWKF